MVLQAGFHSERHAAVLANKRPIGVHYKMRYGGPFRRKAPPTEGTLVNPGVPYLVMLDRILNRYPPSILVRMHVGMVSQEGFPVEPFTADQTVVGAFIGVSLLVMLYEEIFVGVLLVAIVAFAKPVFRVDVVLYVPVGCSLHFERFLTHRAGEVPFAHVRGLVFFDVLLGHPALALVALDFFVD